MRLGTLIVVTLPLLAACGADGTVPIIHPGHPAGTVVASPSLGSVPFGVAVSAQNDVYITQVQGQISRTAPLSSSFDSVPVSGEPLAAVIPPAGGFLYVAGSPAAGVSRRAIPTLATTDSAEGLAGTPVDVALSTDGQRVFVATTQSVYRFDAATLQEDTALSTGQVHRLAAHPSQALLYASLQDSVLEINGGTMQVVRTFSIPGTLQGVAVNPAGTRAWVAVESDSMIAAVNLQTGQSQPIPLHGCRPYSLLESLDQAVLYASCSLDGAVAVVDLSTGMQSDLIQTGGFPRRMAFTADGRTLIIPDDTGRVIYIQ